MIDTIRVGTMLIEDGTPTPESLAVGTHPYSLGWSSIRKSRWLANSRLQQLLSCV
jgi:hypothetical protein